MDRIIFLGCLLLFVVGGLVGIGVGSSSSLSASLRAAFELLSFAGTTITAVVALVALKSWQTQFRHSEKWKALRDFQDLLDGGVSAHLYLSYLFTMVSQNQAANYAGKSLNLTDEFFSRQKAWMEYCFRVDRAWGRIELLYGGELDVVDSHKVVEEGVRKTSSIFINIMGSNNPTNLFHLVEVLNESTANAADRSRQLFLQAESMLRKLVN